jgi:acyl-CoA reductase-like NAD-dependent aldehyde dehydrogenase
VRADLFTVSASSLYHDLIVPMPSGILGSGKRITIPMLRRNRASKLIPADPLNPSAGFGAVASSAHRDKVLSFITNGVEEGARKYYAGDAPAPFAKRFYLSPVIFDQVSVTHRIAQEEIFGPVLSVLTFADERQAIEIANSSVYGLSAILWTTNLNRAHRMTQRVKAG